MFLMRAFWALSYCDRQSDHLRFIQESIQNQVMKMKEELGTQMMSYPNIHCQMKGDRFSVGFPIDSRRGNLQATLKSIQNIPGAQLVNKVQTRVRGLDSFRYDYRKGSEEFTISLVGPTNQYFYTFEYTKGEEFNQDFARVISIYKEANRPTDPLETPRTRQPQTRQTPVQGDPIENLEALGATVYQGKEGFYDWDYLAGSEQAKREIEDTILLTLERPDIFDKITEVTRVKNEKNRPRAVLFEGPPGTGKTTSAKIISHQVKIPMVYIRLETVMSMYYGEAEKNLGKIFQNCSQLGKCMIFIDEIDSLAQSRQRDMHQATRRILSVFLRYLDGFESSQDVIVICATNRKADLDPALQNRFSKVINFPYPDKHSRYAIFKRYAKHLNQEQLQELTEKSSGMTGRDIKSVCEDAERQWAAKVLRGEQENYHVDYLHYYHSLKSRISQYI